MTRSAHDETLALQGNCSVLDGSPIRGSDEQLAKPAAEPGTAGFESHLVPDVMAAKFTVVRPGGTARDRRLGTASQFHLAERRTGPEHRDRLRIHRADRPGDREGIQMRRNSVLSRAARTAAVCVLAAGLLVGGTAAADAADVPTPRAPALTASAPLVPGPGGGHGGHGHGGGGRYHGGGHGDDGYRGDYGYYGDDGYPGDDGYSGDYGYSDGCEYPYYGGYYNPYDDC